MINLNNFSRQFQIDKQIKLFVEIATEIIEKFTLTVTPQTVNVQQKHILLGAVEQHNHIKLQNHLRNI